MQNSPPSLSLSAAAWFFVGQGDNSGHSNNIEVVCPFTIGRSPACNLTLASRSVSGTHARITEVDGKLWISDCGSTNGTFLNGKKIEGKMQVNDGDTVQFAAVVFQVKNSEKPKTQVQKVPTRSSTDAHTGAVETLQTLQFDRLFDGGVVPFFQPIIQLSEGVSAVTGVEVLGRSRIFGLRTPAQMFAAASRVEMEAELSRVLRRQGVEIANENLSEDLTLFVNTHPAELHCPGLVESLREARDVCPERLITVEVCESALNDIDQIIKLRAALDELKIKLAFDNFGAGQSRLFALSEVIPDYIKFDHKLIQGIDKAPRKRRKFVTALVRMITDLGITPVAECVEDKSEHEALCDIGFQLAQGFYYGKPASLPDCVEWLNESALVTESRENLDLGDVGQAGNQPSNSPKDEASAADDNTGPKDAEWLLEQTASHYTIQVLSAISEDRAISYVNRQPAPDEFAIFCKQGKTRLLYIVVYGVFADRNLAKAASQNLETVSVTPWIRLLSGIQNELRSNDKTK